MLTIGRIDKRGFFKGESFVAIRAYTIGPGLALPSEDHYSQEAHLNSSPGAAHWQLRTTQTILFCHCDGAITGVTSRICRFRIDGMTT
jgi:dTDP-4-dehydrorhamnose 3,5-epimerase-like enzyme